jgi:hypothetical protein
MVDCRANESCTSELSLEVGKKEVASLLLVSATNMISGHLTEGYSLAWNPESASANLWHEDSEKDELEVKRIRLTRDSWGLLVTITGLHNFMAETLVPYSIHNLYFSQGERLTEIWSASGGEMDYRKSTVGTFAPSADSPVEGFYQIVGEPHTNKWSFKTYRWDSAKQKIVALPPRNKIYAAIIETSSSMDEAMRNEKKLKSDCTDRFVVVSTDRFSLLKPGLFILASPQVEQHAAQTVLAEAQACSQMIAGHVERVR